MKRSKQISLRSLAPKLTNKVAKNSLQLSMVAASGFMLTGCNSETGYIYRSVQDCSLDNPGYDGGCEIAYKKALSQWKQTAPRYRDLFNCEYDFGDGACQEFPPYFIPLMTGFMLGENHQSDDDYDLDFYGVRPLSYSRMKHSAAYGRWVSAQGDLYGDYRKNQVKVSPSTFRGTKGSARVMGRGGFGSTISSRSSFGG